MGKLKEGVEGLEKLSLGLSMGLAILIGVAVGIGLKTLTGLTWTLWIGVFWGVAAAVLNVYKAYKKLQATFEEEAQRRDNRKPLYDDDEDDD